MELQKMEDLKDIKMMVFNISLFNSLAWPCKKTDEYGRW